MISAVATIALKRKPAVLVDVDGTIALNRGRGPFDWARVGEDLPNPPVITAVRALAHAGHPIIVMSGRSDVCRADTAAWLQEHLGVPYIALYMREAGDYNDDAVVKGELYDRHVAGRHEVLCVFDDRQRVVDMWRSIGLTVFQVAPGDF